MNNKLRQIIVAIISALSCAGFLIIYIYHIHNLGFYSEEEQLIALITLCIALFFAGFIHIIVHELGHLIAGLATGYSFGSFRVLSWVIGVRENKFIFYKASIPGTWGQCIMKPPKKDKNNNFPMVCYFAGGVISNFLTAAIALYIFYKIPFTLYISELLIALAVVGIVLALMNVIPYSGTGLANDGMNILRLRKDKISRDMLYNQLTIIRLLQQGKSCLEMPEELFAIPENADFSNYLIITIVVFRFMKYQEITNQKKAKETLKFILEQENLLPLYRSVLILEQLYYDILDNNSNINIDNYLDNNTKKYMKVTKNFPSTLRVNYAIMKMVEKNEAEAEKVLKLFAKSLQQHPYPAEVIKERRLLQQVITQI